MTATITTPTATAEALQEARQQLHQLQQDVEAREAIVAVLTQELTFAQETLQGVQVQRSHLVALVQSLGAQRKNAEEALGRNRAKPNEPFYAEKLAALVDQDALAQKRLIEFDESSLVADAKAIVSKAQAMLDTAQANLKADRKSLEVASIAFQQTFASWGKSIIAEAKAKLHPLDAWIAAQQKTVEGIRDHARREESQLNELQREHSAILDASREALRDFPSLQVNLKYDRSRASAARVLNAQLDLLSVLLAEGATFGNIGNEGPLDPKDLRWWEILELMSLPWADFLPARRGDDKSVPALTQRLKDIQEYIETKLK